MNEASVSEATPSARGAQRQGASFARRLVHGLLGHLECGSLALHEAGEVRHFGDTGGNGVTATIHINDPRAYRHFVAGGTIGAGESYMLGLWQSPCLTDVIRLFCANMVAMERMEGGVSLFRRLAQRVVHALKRNSLNGARRNIQAHYDLGNDFFSLFLDPAMMYSSAVFPSEDATLEVASRHKLELLCRDLELTEDDHLLEIGSGWGGMAIFAASEYGCRVTTTTISREQYEYTLGKVRDAGLEDRISVLCQDYRVLQGSYDKVVSIEMVEAVGYEFYGEFFRRCNALLKPDGKFVMQAITIQDQRFEAARDTVDFIKRYIFPGGCLPSLEVISRHVSRDTDLQMIALRDITADYARTLAQWRARFLAAREQVRALGFEERFQRMWEFYLCYCEGGFRERVISTVQLTFAGPQYRFPAT
jgi:cyclopropane-fatty-acyl-phospholipid synthase